MRANRVALLLISFLVVALQPTASAIGQDADVNEILDEFFAKGMPLHEKVIIEDCHAIVYGWDVLGPVELALEDTVVYLGEWQVYPVLVPPVKIPEPSPLSNKRYALHEEAYDLHRELHAQGVSPEEAKKQIVELYRSSTLVDSVWHAQGNNYRMLWKGDTLRGGFTLEDEPYTPPSRETYLKSCRREARMRFDSCQRDFKARRLIIISSYGRGSRARRGKEKALAEIAELRAMDASEVTKETWTFERSIDFRIAQQIASPLPLSY